MFTLFIITSRYLAGITALVSMHSTVQTLCCLKRSQLSKENYKIFKIMILTHLIFIFLTSFSFAQTQDVVLQKQPSDPVLPDTFMVQFNETLYPSYPNRSIKYYTHGVQYYDFPSRSGRVDRQHGQYDRFCSYKGMPDTPCIQLVVNGIRWIVRPELKTCCQ